MKNKAKIVATLGPASASKPIMKKMVEEGVNVFRLNFSHGSHEDHKKSMSIIKELNQENNWNIATLADLQGPKLRVGDVADGTFLKEGTNFDIITTPVLGNEKEAYLTYENFPKDVKPGEKLLIDDGKLLLEVVETNQTDRVSTKVLQGGPLKSKKGVNLPNTKISLPCLTEKDLADLEVALEGGAEWIGLSFVRQPEDVKELRERIEASNHSAHIISKIEKPEAVDCIEEILNYTDAVMVARGDLGVEVPLQNVPLIQKKIVKKALNAGKPVIIATQMMESMIENFSPTRAEVNDVANSVLDGADAMMLSGETSVGKDPVQVIRTMRQIISQVEQNAEITGNETVPEKHNNPRFITDIICYNASETGDQVNAKGILSMTFSGYTGFKISSYRPKGMIWVFTANRAILNTVSLIWGAKGYFYDNMESTDQTFQDVKDILLKDGEVGSGDLIVKVASMPIKSAGMTNMLKLSLV